MPEQTPCSYFLGASLRHDDRTWQRFDEPAVRGPRTLGGGGAHLASSRSTLAGIVFFSFTACSSAAAVELGSWSRLEGWFACCSTASSNSHASSSRLYRQNRHPNRRCRTPRRLEGLQRNTRAGGQHLEAEGDADSAFFFCL